MKQKELLNNDHQLQKKKEEIPENDVPYTANCKEEDKGKNNDCNESKVSSKIGKDELSVIQDSQINSHQIFSKDKESVPKIDSSEDVSMQKDNMSKSMTSKIKLKSKIN